MKNMNKVRLFSIFASLILITLIITSASCSQCAKKTSTEEITEIAEEIASTEETQATIEKEEELTQASSKEETTTSTTKKPTESTASGTTSAVTTVEELSAPTINLRIYQGPTYSEADGVCYYRIEAIVTGNPVPVVDFSKDDSGGAWGPNKCQINLNDPSETYNLIAKTANSEGYATDSLMLSWGCSETPEGSLGETSTTTETTTETATTETEEEIILRPGWDFSGVSSDIIRTLDKIIINPINIGYIVYPSGINTETAIAGDSISNTEVHGYFGFDRMGVFSGREVESVSLKLTTYKFWDDIPSDIFTRFWIGFADEKFFPLDSSDWSHTGGTSWGLSTVYDPIEINDNYLKDKVIEAINNNDTLEFMMYYGGVIPIVDPDNNIDGREYRKQDITLTIDFAD